MPEIEKMAVPQVLRLPHDWIIDPVPWWVLANLEDRVRVELTTIALEHRRAVLDAQRAVLDAEMRALERSMEVLAR